ncbi:hypothetical protein ACOM2C_16595 [Pseudarthrobacter sp. So.54]
MTASQHHPATLALQSLFTLANETEWEIARGMGLNLTDFRALSVLGLSGPVTVGKLAEELGATPATTTAIVSGWSPAATLRAAAVPTTAARSK